MKLLAIPVLKQCMSRHAQSKKVIQSLILVIQNPNTVWKSYSDILEAYPTAVPIPTKRDYRIKFSFKNNKYRVVAVVDFEDSIIEIRFAGTHAEYDKIDANTV